MKCNSCGHENRTGRKFCAACGLPLALLCGACGTPNQIGESFCGECGGALGESPRTTSKVIVASPQRSPADYTPKYLADKILQSKSVLEGERKQVTVFFADVKGSMDLAAQLDPEEWHIILDRFFAILTDGVHRFEGTVNQYTGDGIMALFGAPIAHEDHARRACYAALHIVEEIRRYALELRLSRGLNFSTRMGLNSGEVIVGKIGDNLRMDYTAQGQTVNLAARMEQIAEPGKIYLTSATATQVEGYFALADLGEMTVKGAQAPMRVYELQGMGRINARLDVSRARGFSRFVGRGDEMQVLESALARAGQGQAQVVGIVGDAGLGKSRLCFEFLERCRSRGLMTYETTGVSHGKSIPFLPVLRLFRSFFGIVDQDSDTTARERIAGRLLLLDERLREALPILFDFMGVADPTAPVERIDPDARQRQIFDIVRRVVQARGQSETSITLLEDLHWFDGGSASFLGPLIEAAAGTRNLILLNFRPEYRAPWMGRSFYHQIPLSPLGPEGTRELLDATLGNDPSTRGLADAIHLRTAGNPFYTEEVVHSLIESGKLQGKRGAYRLVASIDKLEVPSSIHALLAARIDRLDARDKEVLQTAAIIGREFDGPTLAEISGLDANALHESLQKLKDSEFIYEQALFPVAEYIFKHPLTHEVALNSQLQDRRRRLHAAVARVIESTNASDVDRKSALLAHHWEHADDPLQATRWHQRAAEWVSLHDPTEGIRHWRSVRRLGQSLVDTESLEARLKASATIISSGSWRVGMTENEVHACLDEARTLAIRLGRPNAAAGAMIGLAAHLGTSGQPARAAAVMTDARGMLDDNAEASERIAIESLYAYWHFQAGDIAESIETFTGVLRRVQGDSRIGRELVGFSPKLFDEMMLGTAYAQAGRFTEAWHASIQAIHSARTSEDREAIIWALGFSQAGYLAQGTSGIAPHRVLQASLEAVEIAERVGSPYSRIAARFYLAIAHFLASEWDASDRMFDEAFTSARNLRTVLEWVPFYVCIYADCRRAMGDVAGAIAFARVAIVEADNAGARFQSAIARTVLADVLFAANPSDGEIVEAIAAARELIMQTGGDSLLPRLREAEARFLGRANAEILVSGLQDAEALYRAQGAVDPADRLAKELASLQPVGSKYSIEVIGP